MKIVTSIAQQFSGIKNIGPDGVINRKSATVHTIKSNVILVKISAFA